MGHDVLRSKVPGQWESWVTSRNTREIQQHMITETYAKEFSPLLGKVAGLTSDVASAQRSAVEQYKEAFTSELNALMSASETRTKAFQLYSALVMATTYILRK